MALTFVVEPRKGGLFAERASPEVLTLLAIAVGLGAGMVIRVLRRRGARRWISRVATAGAPGRPRGPALTHA
jgi:hypothetical protein